MERVRLIEAGLNRDGIGARAGEEEILREVVGGRIVVLKGVFPAADAARLRELVFNWGNAEKPSEQKEFYSLTRSNHFCLERGVSKIQKTLHYYRSHNFNNFSEGLPAELSELLGKFCAPLRDFYNRLVGGAADFVGEKFIHPQVIHYPSGAGHFAKHSHPLEPQRIGVITSLSEHGVDFRQGGTGFEIEGDAVDTEPFHEIGDVALFRYDLPHWVTPVDIEDALEPTSSRGRWTLVIPYY
jgi:hypothetical protein